MTFRVFDLEANGWANVADTIWCIATYDLGTRVERFFGPDEIDEGIAYLAEAEVIIAHNLLGYDLPLIQRLYPSFVPKAYEDSLVLSRLTSPDRVNGHSIDAWGKVCGKAKPVHTDFTQYSEDMKVRCIEDTRINAAAIRMIENEWGKQDWADAIRLEYSMQRMQSRQEQRGIRLDIPAATSLRDRLSEELNSINTELEAMLPHQIKEGSKYLAPWTKAGKLNHHVAKWIPEDMHHCIAGPMTGVKILPFNLNSPQQVTNLLYANGWEPTEFNYAKKKGGGYELNRDGSYKISSPKLTEDSMESIQGTLGQQIARRRLLTHRHGMLDRINQKTGQAAGWLNEVREDGRMEAGGIPMGTPTSRWTHFGIVNVPSVEAELGKQLRSLLVPTDGLVFVGTDASGLEARVAGHLAWKYDDGEYARLLLEGDIHTANANVFSSVAQKEITRSEAKAIGYALMFGASARKICNMVLVDINVAEEMVMSFWETNKGLGKLRDVTIKLAKRNGFLVGLDGRRVPCRSAHSALNTLIQSTGAILMKNSFDLIQPHDDWHCVYTCHDEMTCEMEQSFTDKHIARWTDIGEELTEKFKLSVPLIFDSNIGENYAAVH